MSTQNKKRRYLNLAEFGGDIAYVVRNLGAASSITLGRGLPPAFRERLMLVVTAANECRYCAHFHGTLARGTGISKEDVSAMLDGIIENCPENEALALGYAQNWAENDGVSDPAIRARVVAQYGPDTAHLIDVTLRLIRIGNLTWNTVDSVAYDISGGKVGAS